MPLAINIYLVSICFIRQVSWFYSAGAPAVARKYPTHPLSHYDNVETNCVGRCDLYCQ